MGTKQQWIEFESTGSTSGWTDHNTHIRFTQIASTSGYYKYTVEMWCAENSNVTVNSISVKVNGTEYAPSNVSYTNITKVNSYVIEIPSTNPVVFPSSLDLSKVTVSVNFTQKDSTYGDCTFTGNGDISLDPFKVYTLTYSAGTGVKSISAKIGTANSGIISANTSLSSGSAIYESDVISVTATPNSGYSLNNGVSSASRTYNYEVNGDVTCKPVAISLIDGAVYIYDGTDWQVGVAYRERDGVYEGNDGIFYVSNGKAWVRSM